MNKKIMLLLALLILFCPVSVYAKDSSESQIGEDLESGVRDEKGVFTSGTVIYQNEVSGKLYGHKYIVEGDGLYVETNNERTVVIIKTTGNAVITQYNSSPDSPNIWKPDANKIYLSKDMPYSIQPIVNLTSSLPVFNYDDENFEENLKKYIDSGDISGAENALDIGPENDDSIELPKNLNISGGYAQRLNAAYSIDKDIVLNWIQTVDTSDYIYQVDAQVVMDMKSKNFGASHNTGEYYSSDWISFGEKEYEGAKQIALTLNHKELDTKLIDSFFSNYQKKTGKVVPYKGYSVASIKVRVRNCEGAGVSNYVVVTIDKEGVTNTATVEDEKGNTVDNEDYDGSSDITNKEDSQDFDLSGIAEVLDLIKNGFGLFGNNGLIAMFASFFSFLPSKYWSLIMLGMATMVFIGLLNFLLKR